jgi:Antitoxin ParD
MRLSIEISPEQHQRLKASAALQGQSIKDYVLARTLPDSNEQSALLELESFLRPRIQAANNGELSSKSVDDIFDAVEQEQNG